MSYLHSTTTRSGRSLLPSPSCTSAVETLQCEDPGLYMPAECHLVFSKVPRLDYSLSTVPNKKILKAGGPLPSVAMAKKSSAHCFVALVGPRKHYPELWLSLGGVGLYECLRGPSLPLQHPPAQAQPELHPQLSFLSADRALEDPHLAGREAKAQKERDRVQSLGEVRGSGRVPLSVLCPFY